MGPATHMIYQLNVHNLAIVDDVTLSFEGGMSSLTGETGAGKSILIHALGLVLGDRADANMIREGHDRAEIEAHFDIRPLTLVKSWLVEHDLDDNEQCVIRRVLTRQRTSRAYINGRSVPITHLRYIGQHTIEIHGQHAHQSLVNTDTQRALLDIAAGNAPLLQQLATDYQQWQQTLLSIEQYQQQAEQITAQRSLIQYQLDELSSYDLSDKAIQQLLQEQKSLSHAEQLISTTQSSLGLLTEQEHHSIYSLINQVITQLTTLAPVAPKFNQFIDTLTSASIQVDETATDIQHYMESIDLEPERLQQVEMTLSSLHQLARKHHIDIEQLPSHYQQLQQTLAALSQSADEQAVLEQTAAQLALQCRSHCEAITQQRKEAAVILSHSITETINQLAMPKGEVHFDISPLPNEALTINGADSIALLVKTNPGQSLGPLGKVASGGELARISLAIQVATAGTRNIPTFVFDEVDVGIGGSTAEIVGRYLKQLAQAQQVICITHLPQVASQAQQQLRIEKQHSNDSTSITVSVLDPSERINEIARMLGGVTITEATRQHAEEMLTQSHAI